MNIFNKPHSHCYEELINREVEVNNTNDEHYLGNGLNGCPIFLDIDTKSIYSRWSKVSSDGIMDIDLRSIALDKVNKGTVFYDGLGLLITTLDSKNSLYPYAPFSFSYSTIQTIYNLYTDKTVDGFIGPINSLYNKLPINLVDKVLRYYDCPFYLTKPYFCLLKDTVGQPYRKILSKDGVTNLYTLDIPWMSVWKHIPMWELEPQLELRNYLRILALKIATDRVEFKRHLFIGICHKRELKKKRIILFSFIGSKLSPMKVDPNYVQLCKNILNNYSGYTQNAFFSWFYFPIIEPIEYHKVFDRANSRFNTLPGDLLDKVFL